MTLVGRHEALSVYEDALRRGGVVVVRGGAGTGKTALLREFCLFSDVTVLSAAGSYATRNRAFGLVTRLLAGSGLDAAERVVLVVDDVQWADPESLRWLAEQSAVLVLAVSEGAPGWDSPEVEEVLFAGTHHVRLGGLDLDETRAMLGSAPVDAEECWRVTQGVPALVAAFAEGADVALPTRVRLRRTGPAAMDVFLCVALFGTAPADVIARFCGRSGAEVLAACAQLRAAGLVEDGMSVAQPMVREAVLRGCPPAELRALHGRAARFRHDEGDGPEVVADHLLGSAPGDESWVVDVLLAAAGTALPAGEPDRAVALLRRALAERTGRVQEIYALLAEAQVRGDVVGATRTLARAVTAEVDLGLFNVLMLDGQRDQAAAIARRAGEGRERMLARLAWLPSDVPESLVVTEDSLMSAVGAMSHALAGRSREAVLDVVTELSDRAPVDVDVMFARVISTDVLVLAGQLSSALQSCDPVVRAAESLGHWPALAYALSSRAQIQHRMGLLGAAERDAARALEIAVGCGMDRTGRAVRTIIAILVELALDRGDPVAAAELLTAQQPVTSEIAEPGGEALLFARARLRAATGDVRRACGDLVRCGELLAAMGVRNPAAVPWRAELARLRSPELFDEEITLAREWGAPATVGRALLAAGRDEAVDVLTGTEDAYLLAQALLQRGVQLPERGDVAGARRELRRAHEIADGLDCEHLVSRIRAEIIAVGGRPPKRRPSGVKAMTEAEIRVARLVALGHKNREIAQELFVLERTVEVHLTRVYRKLGIEGRAQLVTLLNAEQGVVV
ncbi:LuxR C-terminal-related transcriptional regulator [Lentzea sp. HUAS TT2]|uniref:helix-turn-helix transcriptional regulator n=1 Tax=Lentzea sp. HUAS TT2 TaxID=3447454 RepID=UPI003F6FE08B